MKMKKNFLVNMNYIIYKVIRKLYNYINKLQFLLFIIFFNLKLYLNIKTNPYKITIKLNNNCNLKCNFCNIWKNKNISILSFEYLKKFISNYWNNIKILSFTWWETFLLNDIKEKIIYGIKKCKNLNIFSITTNWFFTQKIISNIEEILKKINNKILIVNISIDWWSKLHNKLRWNNLSYNNAVNTYKQLLNLQKEYPNLEVNQEFLLNEKNYFLLKEKIKEKNTIISIVQNSNYYWKHNINTKFIKFTTKILKNTKWYLKKRFLIWSINKNYNCYATKSSLFIDWNWDIKPCIIWDKPLWNIKTNNIIEDIQNKKYINIQNKIKEKKCPWCWTPCEWYLSIIHEFWK
jgi:MoaA/NifB/PqqE/SkfB family radical SAM enzyme